MRWSRRSSPARCPRSTAWCRRLRSSPCATLSHERGQRAVVAESDRAPGDELVAHLVLILGEEHEDLLGAEAGARVRDDVGDAIADAGGDRDAQRVQGVDLELLLRGAGLHEALVRE